MYGAPAVEGRGRASKGVEGSGRAWKDLFRLEYGAALVFFSEIKLHRSIMFVIENR